MIVPISAFAGTKKCLTRSRLPAMKIGELAKASSTPVETIRYYEREGLLAAPAHRGQFPRLRRPPIGAPEVHPLLPRPGHVAGRGALRCCFRDQPESECGDVNALLDEHIGHVSRRIAELRSLERTS